MLFFFFLSSRRRHTRFDCDWSSDVCSSDLDLTFDPLAKQPRELFRRLQTLDADFVQAAVQGSAKLLTPFDFLSRSEEHTSELQSQSNLVCRLLLEKKKKDEL